MASNKEEIKDSKAGLVANIIGALAFLAVGICLIAFDAALIAKMIYSFSILGLGILFICFGMYYMIKYFFNREYIRITSYGFTMGVILVIIGAVFIINADVVSSFIDALVCLIGVVFGAVMLQQSFALFHIQRGSWFLSLLLGIATIAGSIYILLTPIKIFAGSMISYIYLIVVGAFSLFSLLLMVIGLNDHKKDSDRLFKRNMEESPLMSGKKADDSIFEEEPFFETHEEKDDKPAEGSDDLFEE
ncbi:Uncharacterized membrane protein HdeD, DUF308 family [Pseudobutyrivibrio sp. OR37]|uniref:DUF308 domain-containing protein n=1 Tax=Pseudobutyrivibrio sp. OR37 TaxID=1798186 RepID=UPI0008E41F14|nr:DUF308 domain-containing protein [Pseudobutyrivibrio sp. OR37]SFH61571.1 Uncharacterized membrane protein HdeD, DUF308 family [Pseudobutyrivibrio sp. OR37]